MGSQWRAWHCSKSRKRPLAHDGRERQRGPVTGLDGGQPAELGRPHCRSPAQSDGFYAIDRVKAGDDALRGCVDAEIGEVTGRRLIHLQCHFGLDSIRLARRGAIVTGLDFSAAAIAAARALAVELAVRARFVEGNVYDAPALLNAQYEIAFVTWGSIIWLPDIRLWARIVAELLAPGGWLYLAEGHPSTLSLDEVDGRLVALQSWRTPPSAPFFTTRRRRTPVIQRRSPTPGATSGVIR
jgi:SAM-dependent methyltransferase